MLVTAAGASQPLLLQDSTYEYQAKDVVQLAHACANTHSDDEDIERDPHSLARACLEYLEAQNLTSYQNTRSGLTREDVSMVCSAVLSLHNKVIRRETDREE